MSVLALLFISQLLFHDYENSFWNWHAIKKVPRDLLFDFGSNDGNSIELFFGNTRKHRAENNTQMSLQDHFFGLGQKGGWEVHVLEPNPRYYDQLLKVTTRLKTIHPTAKFTIYKSTAVTAVGGDTTLYLDDPIGGKGSSIVTKHKNSFPITVKAISVEKLFHQIEVRDADNVIVNMDIAGAEFMILEKLIKSKLIHQIDMLFVKWNHENPSMRWTKEQAENLTDRKKRIEQKLNDTLVKFFTR